MKILHLSLVVLLGAITAVFAKAYPYFITEDEGVHISANGNRTVEPDKIAEAKNAKDSRPADQDREGNWGIVTNGMQASIRFDKGSFATNSPIMATVIIRNVGQDWRMFTMPLGLASCISVLNPEQNQLERKDWADAKSNIGQLQRLSHGANATHVDPGMQRRMRIDLQQFYNFSVPGKYRISVKVKTYAERSSEFKWVQSGEAEIQITNSIALIPNSPVLNSPK